MTPKELKEHFLKRDDDAIRELNSLYYQNESARLAFAEGRLKDLCHLVLDLCEYIEEMEKK